MKLRTIGAVLAGAAMIGATVAGAAAAADVPAKSWWIDPATGQPNVAIVVGAQANASDVVSASLIAAAVGNMATVEETASVPKTSSATFDKVYAYAYPTLPAVNLPWELVCGGTATGIFGKTYPWATLFTGAATFDTLEDGTPDTADNWRDVSIVMPVEWKGGAPAVSGVKKLDTLWFSNSPKAWDAKDNVYYFKFAGATGNYNNYFLVNRTDGVDNIPVAYAGGSYDDGDGEFDLLYSNFGINSWVNVAAVAPGETYDPACDYAFGGTGTAMEAHEEIQVITSDVTRCEGLTCIPNGIADLIGDKGHFSGIVYRTAEIRYPLRENGQNICGISKCDGMIDFETARKGYLNEIKFLGKMYHPLFAGETVYKDGDTYKSLGAYFVSGKPYAEKEKIMKVGDVYNYHGWTVTLNDVNIYENKAYITVAGPTLAAPFSFIMVMDAGESCRACCPDCAIYGGNGSFTSNPTRQYEYDPFVNKTTTTKTKSGYDYNHYTVTNFMLDGIKTFVGADGTYLAEFNLYALEELQVLTDKDCCDPFVTTPNDYALDINGGWIYSPYPGLTVAPATALTDPVMLWEPTPACTPCGDANYDTLELQLCDTIVIPDCETSYTINGPENYFSVEFTDVKYGGDGSGYANPVFTTVGDGDGVKLIIKQTVAGQVIKYTANVKIDPVELIMLDIETNTATNTKNLVLVGGPVYNSIVKDLVDMGASTVDWATSAGEWEWIADPMAKGYDVLIVAGANREETRMAAEDLIGMLN